MTDHTQPDHPRHAHWLRIAKWFLTSVMVLALLQATGHAGTALLQGRVVNVTDGDTVTLLDDQQALHKIRLAGIDAPESAMPYGHEAGRFLVGMVLGKVVQAVTYKQDRYGRTIATLMVGTKDVNLAMIQAGLAWHYKHYAKDQPANEALAYEQAENTARELHLALWQENAPTAPWDWRVDRRINLQNRRVSLAMRPYSSPYFAINQIAINDVINSSAMRLNTVQRCSMRYFKNKYPPQVHADPLS